MLKIIIGSYEQMLLGYNITKTDTGTYKEKLAFTDHSHTGSIKSVATGGNFLASGSTDEIIYLFNLAKNKEEGALYAHDGSITKLYFAKDILISAGEDGNMCVFDASKKWEKLKVLKGHKAPVTDFSIHPSHKLSLSVSKDATLRTWNLINGREAYIKNNKQLMPEFVEWEPGAGEHYFIASTKMIQIFELVTATVVSEIKFKSNMLAFKFLFKGFIAIGGEEGCIEIYDISNTEKCCLKTKVHEHRIKSIEVINPPTQFYDNGEGIIWLISGSSSGEIKIFEIDVNEFVTTKCMNCVLSFDTTARITCLACWKM